MINSKLTVLFENPFWIGIYERTCDGMYEVCKITFGSEPKDYEIYDLILNRWSSLKFSAPIKSGKVKERRINPKRMQREINEQMKNKGIATKAQEALKLQHEQTVKTRKAARSAKTAEEKNEKYKIKKNKKKDKHKGR